MESETDPDFKLINKIVENYFPPQKFVEAILQYYSLINRSIRSFSG